MRFKVNWNAFRLSMARYAGTIYVEETDEVYRLFMCPQETVWTEIRKTNQVQDFRFIDSILQADNVVKTEQVDWTKTEPEPEAAPDEELQNPEGELRTLEEAAEEGVEEEDNGGD